MSRKLSAGGTSWIGKAREQVIYVLPLQAQVTHASHCTIVQFV